MMSLLYFLTFFHMNAFFRLSLEGFFYLLDNIEGRLNCAGASLYGDSSVDERRLRKVIR